MLVLQIGDTPLRRDHDLKDLEARRFHREQTDSLEEAIAFLNLYEFDCILADLDKFKASGFEMIRQIRRVSNVPIIGITTSIDPRVKIGALDMGADDVLMCGVDEIVARIRAIVRRRFGHTDSVIRCGRIELSIVAHQASVAGVPLRLGPKEYLLLEFLILKSGTAVSKTACLTHLYGTEEYPELKTIDVVLCRLRKRLAPHGLAEMIESVWGYGFKLRSPDAEPMPPEPARPALAAA